MAPPAHAVAHVRARFQVITDYASLQVDAAKEAQRRDLASMMPTLIQSAEFAIFRDLALHELDTTATGTTSGDTIPIPAGSAAIERISLAVNGRDYTLDYSTMAGASPSSAGVPVWYTVENGAIRLIPAPAGPYTYTIHYAANLEPLSDTNTTNWLLLNAADVYLYRTCVQIGIHTHDDPLIQRHMQLYSDALDSVRRKDERARLTRKGGLQIRPRGCR